MPVHVLGYDVPVWIVIATPLVTASYLYFTWHFGVFKKMGVKGARPLPILGTMLGVMRKGMVGGIPDMKKYGKVSGGFLGRLPLLNVADAEMLKEIMVKSFNSFPNRMSFHTQVPIESKMLTVIRDDHWRHVRALMSPSFSARKLRAMTPQIQRCSKILVKNLQVKAENGENIEFKEYTGAFTMDAIASTGFGLQLDSQNDRQNPFVQNGKKAFDFSFTRPSLVLLLFFPDVFHFLTGLNLISFFPRDCLKFFETFVNKAIEERSKTKMEKPDFLQLMMNAHLVDPEDDDELGKDIKFVQGDQGLWTKQGLTHEEIVAQSILFLLAGYDTTATSLAFMGYCLATNPECQEKLIEEIDSVMDGLTDPNYDILKKLSYMDMVLSETLRIYPAVPIMDRVASEEIIINGLTIPKGMVISLNFYLLHHDPDAWPEPEQFRPERFTAEEKAKRHPNQWMPFGAGPRHCLGMRLALMETKMAMVYLLQNFRFRTCDKTQIPVKLEKLRMSAEGGIYLKLEKRTDLHL